VENKERNRQLNEEHLPLSRALHSMKIMPALRPITTRAQSLASMVNRSTLEIAPISMSGTNLQIRNPIQRFSSRLRKHWRRSPIVAELFNKSGSSIRESKIRKATTQVIYLISLIS
jgi:hypothetical protein